MMIIGKSEIDFEQKLENDKASFWRQLNFLC